MKYPNLKTWIFFFIIYKVAVDVASCIPPFVDWVGRFKMVAFKILLVYS